MVLCQSVQCSVDSVVIEAEPRNVKLREQRRFLGERDLLPSWRPRPRTRVAVNVGLSKSRGRISSL